MPELPEVETTKKSLEPILEWEVVDLQVYQPKLRWMMPDNLSELIGYQLSKVERRAKYLVLTFSDAVFEKKLIIHLGMSGSLQQSELIIDKDICCDSNKQKHDHLIMVFRGKNNRLKQLRYHDPRRFGAVLWADEYADKLFNHLGVEPLTEAFTETYLYNYIQNQQKTPIKRAIKSVIMEQKVVVGVGNIYATESLFLSGIHPAMPANEVSKESITLLVKHIKSILSTAIEKGGSSLKDFSTGEGKTGYFQQTLLVYGRDGEQCPSCHTILENIKINGRASVYCPSCQPL